MKLCTCTYYGIINDLCIIQKYLNKTHFASKAALSSSIFFFISSFYFIISCFISSICCFISSFCCFISLISTDCSQTRYSFKRMISGCLISSLSEFNLNMISNYYWAESLKTFDISISWCKMSNTSESKIWNIWTESVSFFSWRLSCWMYCNTSSWFRIV